MTRRLVSPFGDEIVGTLERVPGVANIGSIYRTESGQVTYDYAGWTELYWDDQETITRNGQVVFVDESGQEWLESELVEAEDE